MAKSSTSWSTQGHHTKPWASDFVWTTPRWPLCSSCSMCCCNLTRIMTPVLYSTLSPSTNISSLFNQRGRKASWTWSGQLFQVYAKALLSDAFACVVVMTWDGQTSRTSNWAILNTGGTSHFPKVDFSIIEIAHSIWNTLNDASIANWKMAGLDKWYRYGHLNLSSDSHSTIFFDIGTMGAAHSLSSTFCNMLAVTGCFSFLSMASLMANGMEQGWPEQEVASSCRVQRVLMSFIVPSPSWNTPEYLLVSCSTTLELLSIAVKWILCYSPF